MFSIAFLASVFSWTTSAVGPTLFFAANALLLRIIGACLHQRTLRKFVAFRNRAQLMVPLIGNPVTSFDPTTFIKLFLSIVGIVDQLQAENLPKPEHGLVFFTVEELVGQHDIDFSYHQEESKDMIWPPPGTPKLLE